MQVTLSTSEQDAFIHAWRYIGYLLGMDDNVNPCTSIEQAHAFLYQFYATVPLAVPTNACRILVYIYDILL